MGFNPILPDAFTARVNLDLIAPHRVKEPDGDIAVEIPLTIGAVAGGPIVIAAPILAITGALIAFFTKVKVEIIREEETDKQANDT